MLYLIAASVEGPWWELWQDIASRLQLSDMTMHVDGTTLEYDYEDVMFYIEEIGRAHV